LEDYTEEPLFIFGGSEYNSKQGLILVIKQALYGLGSIGNQCHHRLSDCMKKMGFFVCKADNDVWMRLVIDF
jgi:hypothetical protein